MSEVQTEKSRRAPAGRPRWGRLVSGAVLAIELAAVGMMLALFGAGSPYRALWMLPVIFFIAFGGKEVLTQVIDRGPASGGHEFDLTQRLAERLGLAGVQPIRWSFAQG